MAHVDHSNSEGIRRVLVHKLRLRRRVSEDDGEALTVE